MSYIIQFIKLLVMKSTCLRFSLIALILASTVFGFGQQKKITGKVLGDESKPLAGVSVIVKGKSTGTQTGAAGDFAIEAAPSEVLVFSFSGYRTQEVKVGASSALTISLEVTASVLEDVVVTGRSEEHTSELQSH